MPYIKQEQRKSLDTMFEFADGFPANAGELQYVIAGMVQLYLANVGIYRYQDLNDVLGALEGAKLEFYRRVMAPYEDKKIVENGDVYATGA